MTNIFSGRIYLLVTGASRGIGKQITQTFSRLLDEKSTVLLLSRNTEHLQETVQSLPKSLNASYRSVDFSKTSTNEIQGIIEESIKNEKPESFDQAIIIHSAALATLNQLTNEMTDFEEWHKSFDLNMFSPAILNGIFMKTFSDKRIKKHVINISSYWGLKPDAYVGSYCSSKAAKDMFFKVFAIENPDVNVLNYLPGAVNTDMFYEALIDSKNEELKTQLKDMIENKKYVTPAQTADCLVEVLTKRNYKSGDHVDYYKLHPESTGIQDLHQDV